MAFVYNIIFHMKMFPFNDVAMEKKTVYIIYL